jgi:glycosyltransferase involved in cell wall biosynthesis/GT2 family glycosyltransferase
MRICLVSRELAPFYGGGIGTYVACMARAFVDAGHEVHVLTQRHHGLVDGSTRSGVRYHVVALDEGPAGLDAYAFPQQRYAMGVYGTLEALHAQYPFDLVEFPDFSGEGHFALRAKRFAGDFRDAVLAVRLHTPTRDVRTLDKQSWHDAESANLYHQEESAIRDADLVLAPTRAVLARVSARLGTFRQEAVIRHPLDLADAQAAAPVQAGGPEVLYFGRLELRKGVHVLVDAAVSLLEGGSPARFRFIGADTDTGPFGRSFRQYLDERIPERHRDRLLFEPSRARAELAKAIRAATVCCFPSVWENFANACLEAMAAGASVVATSGSGFDEIIEPGVSGLLVPPEDPAELAQGLGILLGDPELRSRLGRGAAERVRSLCDPRRTVSEVVEAVSRVKRPRTSTHHSSHPSPAVSVLVPHYNLGRYLPETLASLRAQTFQDFETLVIDDGSTDRASLDVIAGLSGDRLRVLRKRHGGVSSARNAGLREARGHWILPLDPDDLIAESFIEKAVTVLDREPELAFATTFASFFTEDPDHPTGGWIPWGTALNAMPAMNVASTCTALFLKSRAEQVGGWDEWMTAFEDWDFFCSLAEAGEGAVIPQFLFHYRIRPDSLMRTEAVERKYRLLSYLMQKHPRLATDASEPLRLQLAQTAALDEAVPLRYRLVDGLNEALKRIPMVHPLLKRTLSRVGARPAVRPSR